MSSKENKRRKIECLLCHRVFDDDYRLAHNKNYHSEDVKNNKSIAFKTLGAPPKEAFFGGFKHKAGQEQEVSQSNTNKSNESNANTDIKMKQVHPHL